jgi:hypothetical protein
MMRKQKGFSLVILLTSLVAIGGLAMVERRERFRSNLSLLNAVNLNAELGQSRQALLSYSALYTDLKGQAWDICRARIPIHCYLSRWTGQLIMDRTLLAEMVRWRLGICLVISVSPKSGT